MCTCPVLSSFPFTKWHPSLLLTQLPSLSCHPPLPWSSQELATITAEQLPVKIMILNNQHLGMVVQWEDRFYKVRGPRV